MLPISLCSLNIGIAGTYKMNKDLVLYFGAYFNYGLNNLLKSSNKPVYQDNGTYNGILGSNLTDKVGIMCLGVKVGVLLDTDKWFKK